MSWKCFCCGAREPDPPICFGIEAPWRALIPESEFETRVELTADQCVVDEKSFFIRGHVEIPIRDYPESLAFSVWSSLSETSFLDMCDRWDSIDRADDAPYFGWLSTPISAYPDALLMKLSVQSRRPGLTPLFTVEPGDHPLCIDQREGISIVRWHEIAHELLHC